MGVLLQNKECLCPTEPQPAPFQKLQWLRGLQLRFLMTPAVMALCASQWRPTSKKTAALRGTALTPRCLPQNGAHEESWTKKGTWPLCETNPNKVQRQCSEVTAIGSSPPSKYAKYRKEIAKPLGYVIIVTKKGLGCCYLQDIIWVNSIHIMCEPFVEIRISALT